MEAIFKTQDLLQLGFKQVNEISFVLDIKNQHGYEFTAITVYGNEVQFVCYEVAAHDAPGCKTIEDLKQLIKLFSY